MCRFQKCAYVNKSTYNNNTWTHYQKTTLVVQHVLVGRNVASWKMSPTETSLSFGIIPVKHTQLGTHVVN